jgi:hypothetical protein
MPNKKGSKVAASRARAQVKAHKKAHSTGPVVAAAAYAAPAAVDETAAEEATSAVAVETSAAAPASARAAAPAVRRSNVSRTVSRQREAVVAMQSVNLKREVGTIASLAVVVGIALAVLKIATDIGA